MMNVMNNKELININGGANIPALINTNIDQAIVSYDKIKNHLGIHFNKYETKNHIGQLVVLKTHSWNNGDTYYLGIIKKSYEKDAYWFWSNRTIDIKALNGKDDEVSNPSDCWLYV